MRPRVLLAIAPWYIAALPCAAAAEFLAMSWRYARGRAVMTPWPEMAMDGAGYVLFWGTMCFLFSARCEDPRDNSFWLAAALLAAVVGVGVALLMAPGALLDEPELSGRAPWAAQVLVLGGAASLQVVSLACAPWLHALLARRKERV